jgi:hypothetical protein
MPTRNGRNAVLFTRNGMMNMRNEKWKHDFSPIDQESDLYVDRQHSRFNDWQSAQLTFLPMACKRGSKAHHRGRFCRLENGNNKESKHETVMNLLILN